MSLGKILGANTWNNATTIAVNSQTNLWISLWYNLTIVLYNQVHWVLTKNIFFCFKIFWFQKSKINKVCFMSNLNYLKLSQFWVLVTVSIWKKSKAIKSINFIFVSNKTLLWCQNWCLAANNSGHGQSGEVRVE